MSNPQEVTRYDEVLISILVNEKSILGFLSSIFGFLARRTDFYHVPEGPYENMGFPPGVAEELVIKVLRTCDPKTPKAPNGARKPTDVNNEIMCSTVAQEVEVVTEEDLDDIAILDNTLEVTSNEPVNELLASGVESLSVDHSESCIKDPECVAIDLKKVEVPTIHKIKDKDKHISSTSCSQTVLNTAAVSSSKVIPDDYEPPIIPTQKNSDSYNGAERDNYSWSQSILELDITVKLPPDIKSSKDLKVIINSKDLSVSSRNGEYIINDTFPYKIKATDSIWSISEGKLLIHLEKVQERWWNKLLSSEDPIDLSKIDCSRRMDELPEDHVAKVRELQWNQERKMQGLPTSDEIRNINILKKAWNAPGSPFQGKEFDPSILADPSQAFTSFSSKQ